MVLGRWVLERWAPERWEEVMTWAEEEAVGLALEASRLVVVVTKAAVEEVGAAV